MEKTILIAQALGNVAGFMLKTVIALIMLTETYPPEAHKVIVAFAALGSSFINLYNAIDTVKRWAKKESENNETAKETYSVIWAFLQSMK